MNCFAHRPVFSTRLFCLVLRIALSLAALAGNDDGQAIFPTQLVAHVPYAVIAPFVGIVFMAVSYTHLDVYKRQEQYKKWSFDSLPILPEEWQYAVEPDKGKQFKTCLLYTSRAADNPVYPDVPGRYLQGYGTEILKDRRL